VDLFPTPNRRAHAIALGVFLFGCVSLVPSAGAAAENETGTDVEVSRSVPLPQIAARSDELRNALRDATARLETRPEVVSIETGLPETQASIEQQNAELETLLASLPALEQLADAERSWLNRQGDLALWRKSLAQRASVVESEIDDLDGLRALWTATLAVAEESEAPAEVRATIHANLEAIAATRKTARSSRSKLLTLLNGVAQEELIVSDALASIGSARATIRARILEPDSKPLWASLLVSSSVSAIPGRVQKSVTADFDEIASFLKRRLRGFVPVALAFCASLAMALTIHTRMRRRQPTEELAGSIAVFARPYSIAAICTFLAGLAAFPLAPAVAFDLVGALLLVPVVRVMHPVIHSAFRPILYVLSALYLADRVRDILDGVVLLERTLFFAETVGGTAFLLWLMRPSRLVALTADVGRPTPGIGVAVRVATAMLAISALANLLGYTTFSKVLGKGVLQTAYLSVLLYAAFRIGVTVLLVVLSSPRARRFRIIETQGALLLRWARMALVFGLGLVWAGNSLNAFEIREQVIGTLSALLATPLTLGTVSISLGDIGGFAITILTAAVLSRVIRVLLGEDLLPRLSLGRGVANAISTSAHYLILLGGFFLALGAAGVDFSRFTILAGAFGVGIGFGLQNVVNNFVSGLILLFERPVQVGDAIEVNGLLGEVKRIGIRASLVRTYQGAEVIVPNGNLISSEVTNWTLSDAHRRVEVPVGVAYGNRPADVIEVLRQVIANDTRILPTPPAMVLFRGFGDSSLDFEIRFWAADYADFIQLSSDIASGVYDALAAAGIEIPFPQRDLHLKSVAASVAARLNGSSAD